ncbi:aminoglycoside phosphotransferase family protein [Lederbergia galactosidilytica]|uniref:Aminoglycoside phosphotransferase n=1 Tax=Lederbergia galactosidilytica TaxID=217031 RepID=A0A177ZSQ0_9BACI|nr:aminoglycoside phosphotransferase family protein [Lederbergia galactosidilytica]KRG14389.1 aminoglycoside phosphotransferase [Virgibacillus soli]MBP1916709.1 tRNA A-37 threonylcarbamoyl transferase component Bud32 [Lederbergia galactosidilytica]OAK70966.1 aminoglycoside phosphotransferase [Lederbergia galactosidilytica]
MNNQVERFINPEILALVLSKKLDKTIIRADYQLKELQGGTIGDVRLVTGRVETSDGENLPYKMVLKTQKKFERYGDPDSWRREYDLYTTDFKKVLSNSFRCPECYHAEINGDEIQLWMEYIDGVSGLNLTKEMFECIAEELGRFQGKLYTERPDILQNLPNLSKVEFTKNNYLRYRSWNVLYDYIRSDDCEIPKHLCKMLIDLDNNADEIFNRIEKLPIVLCHRDFWVENIFFSDGKIVLIDWDTTGWGYMGEDIASLITDEADVCHMIEYYQKCIPAYYRGFSKYADVSHISDHCIYELILAMFGYRLVEWYKFAKSPEDKSMHLHTLQNIHEMRDI